MQAVELARSPYAFFWKCLWRSLLALLLFYLFLLGVGQLLAGLKILGSDFARQLLSLTASPLQCLLLGLVTTTCIQSSSVTSTLLVGLVASNAIGIESAICMVMGINIGTGLSNTFVSLGRIRRMENFTQALATTILQNLINLLTVIIIFPLEMMTGFLQKTASFCTEIIALHLPLSPLLFLLSPPVQWCQQFLHGLLKFHSHPDLLTGISLVLLACFTLFFTHLLLLKNMLFILQHRLPYILQQISSPHKARAFSLGFFLTLLMQSSSVTISLLVPLVGANILTLWQVYPILLGSNLGTTTTATLAALITHPAGLTIALVHVLFNCLKILLLPPLATVQRLIISLGELLALQLLK